MIFYKMDWIYNIQNYVALIEKIDYLSCLISTVEKLVIRTFCRTEKQLISQQTPWQTPWKMP